MTVKPPKGLKRYNIFFYEEITQSDRYATLTLQQRFGKNIIHHDKVNILIRHDVDRALNLTIPLGEYEREMGVSSSYYFLTDTAPYDVWASDAPRRLVEMGHEVGIHSDHMYEETALGRNGLLRLQEDIERMSDHCQAKVAGIMWHGSSYLNPYGINNFDLYQNLEPKELGLDYHDSALYQPGTRKWNLSILSDAENNLRFLPRKPQFMLKQMEIGQDLLYVAHPRAMFKEGYCQPLKWPNYPHFPPKTVKRTLLMDLRSMLAYNKNYLGPVKVKWFRKIIMGLEKINYFAFKGSDQ